MTNTKTITDTRGFGRKLADLDKTAVAPFLALAALFVLALSSIRISCRSTTCSTF